MLTERDKEIFEMMSEFGGKTFFEVLEKTFFENKQVAKNRISKLKNQDKLIKLVPTGLMTPRNAIFPSSAGVRLLDELGLKTVISEVSATSVHHLVMEQITYYYLKKIGKEVKRTIVKNWSKDHAHTPDLIYEHQGKNVYVEIERTHKRPEKLAEIFLKIKKDDPHIVLYVFENAKEMEKIGKKIPTFEKVYYVDIPTLITSSEQGKIGAISQKDYIKKIGV